MEAPKKDTDLKLFTGGTNSDTGKEWTPSNQQPFSLNFRRTTLGDKGLGTNILGNILIQAGYLTGNNIGLGWKADEQNGKLYYFNSNDQQYHGIYMLDAITLTVTPVLQNLVDTDGVDILQFDPAYGINMIDITYVQNEITGQVNTLLYWIDGLNKGRKTNVQKCLDKTFTGYGAIITEDFITAYKLTAVYAPSAVYFTDTSRTSNYLYGQQFKFAVRFYYDDNEISNWSDWSGVPVAPNEDFQGQDALTFTNNCINVTFQTGSKLVVKIEIGMLSTSISPIIAGAPDISVPWVSVVTLTKANLSMANDTLYTFSFYNDGSYGDVDPAKIVRQFSFMPRVPQIQALVKIALIYGNFYEGFPSVPPFVSIALSFLPFNLAPDTVSETNAPSISITLESVTSHSTLFNKWFTSQTLFIIGSDVIKGNTFQVITTLAAETPKLEPILGIKTFGPQIIGFSRTLFSTFSYTAGLADTATTVAAAIKQYLRALPAGSVPIISGESTDGFGNVQWTFTIRSHEGKRPYEFSGSVNPVNFIELLDNGNSLNTKKMGSIEKYAIVYEDDDGRTGLANTSDACLVKIPFETEILPGQLTPIGLQQPVVTISIMHLPPLWAKYWRLVRTTGPDTFIQLLIQQVNQVIIANESTYLDMIVGSLFTFQKVHPDTILVYDFSRGDRLRFISWYDPDTLQPTPYQPFFETEILGYTIDEEQFRDATIEVHGNNIVTPSDGVFVDFIGKYIIIDGNQRIIDNVSGGTYILDEDIAVNPNFIASPSYPVTYPNYLIKDTRGILRINNPPPSITFVYRKLLPGSGYTPGNYPVVLTGGTGSGAKANVLVGSGGTVTGLTITSAGNGHYIAGDNLSATIPGGSGFQITVGTMNMSKVEVIRPQQNVDNQDFQNFFDFQQKFEIANWGTPTASHIGMLTNSSGTQTQDPANPDTVPAIVQVTNGDAWVHNRAMPSNNQIPNPQVIIDKICDPNFNDFYASKLYNTGKVYPQDRGQGQVTFNQRVRFSNNFIQNTQVNGLNDFDELDYKDYNDPYGSIILSKFRRGVLYLFKQLKNTWCHVLQKIIVDNAGNQTLATSDDLLNELQYSEWEGGIGDNPEGFIEDGDFMYIPSANSGVFIRIGQDGSIPISQIYFYDKRAKELLNFAQTHNLQIPGGFDKPNGEVIWTVPDFIAYLFNNTINVSDWNTAIAAYPSGTTWAVTQQPANSTATVTDDLIIITGTNTLGNDFFKFQGTKPDTTLTPIINFCFTVVVSPPRATAWRIQTASDYCLQGLGVNNGQQGWKILEQYYPNDLTTTGLIMPNALIISPEAIVPNTATITYHQDVNVTPTGGANGDVWYNMPENILYSKVAGVWGPLYDTAVNSNYVVPIVNLTACPLPTPPAGNWSLHASYNVNIDSVVNGTSSGTPAAFATANVPSGSVLVAVYTTQGTAVNQTIIVQFSGTPAIPGHIKADLVVGGVTVDSHVLLNTFSPYTFTFPVVENDPTPIQLQINSF